MKKHLAVAAVGAVFGALLAVGLPPLPGLAVVVAGWALSRLLGALPALHRRYRAHRLALAYVGVWGWRGRLRAVLATLGLG